MRKKNEYTVEKWDTLQEKTAILLWKGANSVKSTAFKENTSDQTRSDDRWTASCESEGRKCDRVVTFTDERRFRSMFF